MQDLGVAGEGPNILGVLLYVAREAFDGLGQSFVAFLAALLRGGNLLQDSFDGFDAIWLVRVVHWECFCSFSIACGLVAGCGVGEGVLVCGGKDEDNNTGASWFC